LIPLMAVVVVVWILLFFRWEHLLGFGEEWPLEERLDK
jgi:hypothetical protein